MLRIRGKSTSLICWEENRQIAEIAVEKEELPEIELPGDLDLGKEETAEEILPAIAEPSAISKSRGSSLSLGSVVDTG